MKLNPVIVNGHLRSAGERLRASLDSLQVLVIVHTMVVDK